MRLGIFGGTFDPVHYGHLLLAESCREQARLDEVLFIPANISPFKQSSRHTPCAETGETNSASNPDSPSPAHHRAAMLRLAIAGHPSFTLDARELDRGGVSYTIDTLRALAAERPTDELFLLLGADSLADLPAWRSAEEILTLATPLAVHREGSPRPNFQTLAPLVAPARLTEFTQYDITMPLVTLSSTDLRHRVSEGRSIRYQTPDAVAEYIEREGLYRAGRNCSSESLSDGNQGVQ